LLIACIVGSVPPHAIAARHLNGELSIYRKPVNMSLSKLRNLPGIVAALCLIVMPLQAQAKTKPAKAVQPSKERLVLMPLRLGEADQSRQAAMEIALLEGLQQKYEVFSGEQVAKKAREIFMKESKNTTHKECDETRCLQGIAEAFQAELLAIASVSKQDDGYFLALRVQNIFDNKVVYSKSLPCKGCDAYAVVDKLKELVGTPAPVAAAINIALPSVPTIPSVNGIADDADGQTWVEVVKGNTAEDYKMYLDSFPKGKYAKQAIEQRIKLEDYVRAKAEADAAQAELSSWNKAIQVDTEAAYNAYLKQYSTGPHAVLAKIKSKKALEAAIEKIKIAPSITANMVTIPGKNYELGKYEVTQAEWKAVMGSNPSKFSSGGGNYPVENISWNSIQVFLKKLNTKTGRQYRLPTGAEWEYACYGGSQAVYCGSNDINSVAWYNGNSNNTTHPIGQKQANGYGLYDMSGNVWEWMQDQYDDGRVLRGGSWGDSPQLVRASSTLNNELTLRYSYLGFRLARTLP